MNIIQENLNDWLESNMILYEVDQSVPEEHSVISINGSRYALIDPDDVLFNQDMKIIIYDEYIDIDRYNIDHYIFEFGGQYFHTPTDSVKIEFNILKWIGKANQGIEAPFVHLGVHGGYELMNGTGDYDDWCAKAAFIGMESLGICEENTLAGVMQFQKSCVDAGIVPIIGATYTVDFRQDDHGDVAQIKFYVINEDGWINLLRMNNFIRVVGTEFVPFDDLKEHNEGLIAVISYGVNPNLFKYMIDVFDDRLYYQIDTVIYDNDDWDMSILKMTKAYLRDWSTKIPPVLINDSYYIDKEYAHIKKKLNDSINMFSRSSSNQWLKTLYESYDLLVRLFDDDSYDRFSDLFMQMTGNTLEIAERCKYNIPTGIFHMPKFGDGDPENNFNILVDAIQVGFENRIIMNKSSWIADHHDIDDYISRIEVEMKVIKDGGFVDYFLILDDLVKWANKNNILTGIGRGSAGGSLVSFLLGITHLDPLKYDLLFERFLNEGRIGKSLPDIDVDFEGLRRDDVKRYMEHKYGEDRVCSVGTYSKLRVKAAMLAVGSHIKIGDLRYMTGMIKDRDGDWDEIFKSAVDRTPLKTFIKKYPDIINDMRIVFGQPRNESIHACATLILPKEDHNGRERTIFEWIPVKDHDGILISEWEGTLLEEAGFLKEDILGIARLDKFRHTLDLIKDTTGEEVDLFNVPLDDQRVYDLFHEGMNEDVFHFGTRGMKILSREMKPDNINDLIDMNALHRPAAMEVGAHKRYLKVRHGRSRPKYAFGLEEIVKETHGILLYQEQVMKAVVKLGGFTLSEADDVRKAMGKKKRQILTPYKKRFIQHAISIGCPENEAPVIWDEIEEFAGYGFNKSHAAAYSLTGYVSQWLKANYPLQFWTTALEFAESKDLPNILSEISRSEDMYKEWGMIPIRFVPPNINRSGDQFMTDYETSEIYWSLSMIKEVGVVAVNEIISKRAKGGEYYSFKDFFSRVERKKVNKKVIDSMILAGCFDSMFNISSPEERISIFVEYLSVANIKWDNDSLYNEILSDVATNRYWWDIKQKEVSGLGYINYKNLIKGIGFKSTHKVIDAVDVYDDENHNRFVVIGGVITEINRHSGKKGEFANVLIEVNNIHVWVTMWNNVWGRYGDVVGRSQGKIMIVSGKIYPDTWKGENVIETTETSKIEIVG